MDNTSLDKKTKRLARLMYLFLLATTVFSITVFSLNIIFAIAKYNLSAGEILHNRSTAIDRFLINQLSNIAYQFPHLADYDWHRDGVATNIGRFYIRNLVFTLFLLVFQILSIKFLLSWLRKLSEWLYQPEHQRQRILILGCITFIIVSFEAQIMTGFFYPGIRAWTYATRDFEPLASLPQIAIDNQPLSAEEEVIFSRAVLFDNAAYLPAAGYYNFKVFFLEFSTGEILPANYDLIGMPNPNYRYGPIRDADLFFEMVQYGLGEYNQNRQFLLPLEISYPNHVPFMPLDIDYPDAELLEAISYWSLYVEVNEGFNARLVSAVFRERIDGE